MFYYEELERLNGALVPPGLHDQLQTVKVGNREYHFNSGVAADVEGDFNSLMDEFMLTSYLEKLDDVSIYEFSFATKQFKDDVELIFAYGMAMGYWDVYIESNFANMFNDLYYSNSDGHLHHLKLRLTSQSQKRFNLQ